MNNPLWVKSSKKAYKINSSVHIWLIRYSELQKKEKDFYRLLSVQEKKRADNFFFEIDRTRFTVSKGLLRSILGKITSIDPQEIVFTANDHGKPFLKFPQQKLHFNISHSGNLGLIAVSDIESIGIDVEKHSEERATDDIAKRFFSSAEQDIFLKLPGTQKVQGFFNCWSRKEAFIKAFGQGLSFPLSSFDVNLKPGEPAQLLKIRYNDENSKNWTLQDIRIDDGYAAAYCIRSNITFPTFYWLA